MSAFTRWSWVCTACGIADTGIYGNTREAIQKVEAKKEVSHFHEIGQLTQTGEEALK